MKKPESPALEDGANPNDFLVGKSVADFPDTGLVNQFGEPVSFETLPAKPVLLSFIYTNCPDPRMCPLITYKMRQVQKRLNRGEKKPVQFVSVTFDPENDTSAVLKNYGDKRNVNYDNWDFWTGEPGTIRTLARAFKVLTTKVPDDATDQPGTVYNHNMRTFLIDENRVVRYWYPGSDWNVKDVIKRLKELMRND
ncbi:MAG: SCO family protein [bacterium]